MKRTNLAQIKIIVALAISSLTVSVQAAVYLQNNYGATIKFKCAKPNERAFEYTVRNGERMQVPKPERSFDLIPENLYIRTTGMGSSYVSYFYSLDDILNQIKHEQQQHLNQNAIIDVSYTRGITGTSWNIKLDWE